MVRRPLFLAVVGVLAAWGVAAEEAGTLLPEVLVTADRDVSLGSTATLGTAEIAPKRARTSDTASLLTDIPGVSAYGAGGVSSLPVIRGLADDRLRTKVDGMDLVAACPNHMNSPLSYIDPTAVESVQVYAGVTPVSVGGDSIGGSIVVQSAAPAFAEPGQAPRDGGSGRVLSQQRRWLGRESLRHLRHRQHQPQLHRFLRHSPTTTRPAATSRTTPSRAGQATRSIWTR